MKFVLEHGKHGEIKRFKCVECGCIFLADDVDYIQIDTTHFESYCPECIYGSREVKECESE